MAKETHIPLTPEGIAAYIDELRGVGTAEKPIPLKDVAVFLEVTPATIANWRGGKGIPHPRVIDKLRLTPEARKDPTMELPRSKDLRQEEEIRQLKKKLKAAKKKG